MDELTGANCDDGSSNFLNRSEGADGHLTYHRPAVNTQSVLAPQ
jgi:hypothetical protein